MQSRDDLLLDQVELLTPLQKAAVIRRIHNQYDQTASFFPSKKTKNLLAFLTKENANQHKWEQIKRYYQNPANKERRMWNIIEAEFYDALAQQRVSHHERVPTLLKIAQHNESNLNYFCDETKLSIINQVLANEKHIFQYDRTFATLELLDRLRSNKSTKDKWGDLLNYSTTAYNHKNACYKRIVAIFQNHSLDDDHLSYAKVSADNNDVFQAYLYLSQIEKKTPEVMIFLANCCFRLNYYQEAYLLYEKLNNVTGGYENELNECLRNLLKERRFSRVMMQVPNVQPRYGLFDGRTPVSSNEQTQLIQLFETVEFPTALKMKFMVDTVNEYNTKRHRLTSSLESTTLVNTLCNETLTPDEKWDAVILYLFKRQNGSFVNDGKLLARIIISNLINLKLSMQETNQSSHEPASQRRSP